MHESTHKGDKPYQCKQNRKSFESLETVEIPERIHRGEKPYECKQCGKAFKHFRSFQGQKRHHTGETAYVCKTRSKYSVMPGLLEIMKEFTLEKNPTNVGIWGNLDVGKKKP